MEYFRKHPETGVTRPEQVAVIGDRLTTDVMMANFMGSYAVWVKDGVVPPEETSVVSRTFCVGGTLISDGRDVVREPGAEVCEIPAASRIRGSRSSEPI
jgi:ribonucleotide monophosphatase NagD (HAD superfamily)